MWCAFGTLKYKSMEERDYRTIEEKIADCVNDGVMTTPQGSGGFNRRTELMELLRNFKSEIISEIMFGSNSNDE